MHIARSNPLFARIDRVWFGRWKFPEWRRRLLPSSRRDLPTNARRSLLWTCFQHARNYGIPDQLKLTATSFYSDQYRLPRYIQTLPIRPQYILRYNQRRGSCVIRTWLLYGRAQIQPNLADGVAVLRANEVVRGCQVHGCIDMIA